MATLESDVRGNWQDNERFSEWLAATSASEGTAYERAVAWQTIDILISRENRRAQLSFEFPLTPEELQKKDDSAARSAAELFLANRFGLPYYFGVSRLASLASSNIEQFLATAGSCSKSLALLRS